MLKLIIENGRSRIEGDLEPLEIGYKQLKDVLSHELGYMVKGAEWSPKFKENQWDGRISLYNGRDKSFPTGLVPKVIEVFNGFKSQNKLDYKIISRRVRPSSNANITTTGFSLRDYQEIVANKAKEKSMGVISLGTGGGKSITACQIISNVSVTPSVFIVPSVSLLKQTKSVFERHLIVDGEPAIIGAAGGGLFDINMNGVNVITYQTAMNSFNEIFLSQTTKRGKAGTVIPNENAGEKTKLTHPELQENFEKCKRDLRMAEKEARTSLAEIDLEISALQLETDQIRLTQNIKKITAAENKLNKKVASRQTKFNSIVRLDKQRLAKAKLELDTKEHYIAKKAEVRQLIESCQMLFVDEVHLASAVIERISQYAKNAYYKYSCSGTPFREDNQEIRIQGAFGNKIVEITSSDLIEMGVLVTPTICTVKINFCAPKSDTDEYSDIYRKNITECWERNFRIKQFAESFKEDGRPVLILVDYVEHGRILESMIKDALFVPGSDDGDVDPGDEELDYRKSMLNKCCSNQIILIATSWAYTGIDAPPLSVLILGGSVQAATTTYQQIGRVLRRADDTGKYEAIIIDFNHSQPIFHKHYLTRLKVYKNERAYKIKHYRLESSEVPVV